MDRIVFKYSLEDFRLIFYSILNLIFYIVFLLSNFRIGSNKNKIIEQKDKLNMFNFFISKNIKNKSKTNFFLINTGLFISFFGYVVF